MATGWTKASSSRPGLGGTEPVVVFPRDYAEGGKNRRVEFRIIQVGSDAIRAEDFDP